MCGVTALLWGQAYTSAGAARGQDNLWICVAALICTVAVSACGSSKSSHRKKSSRSHASAIAFADCMRAHGVPNFPDPGPARRRADLAGTGINRHAPAFQSASRRCAKLLPGAVGGVRATESQFVAALKFAKCMRVHGFPSFPDPTRVDAPPGPILIVRPGLFFRVSSGFDPTTPAASHSIAACGGQ